VAKNDRTSKTSRPVNDAYTGMLTISLLALVGGCALLYLDYDQHKEKPPQVTRVPSDRPKVAYEKAPPAVDKDKEKEPGEGDGKDKKDMEKDDKKKDDKKGDPG